MYRGEFLNGVHHGRGRFRVADGGVYDGEWRNGQESGNGKYIAPPNEYEGTWTEGQLLRGVWRREGKVHYEGEFISEEHAFLPHGIGKLLDTEGNVAFEGSFQEGKRAGRGTEWLVDGIYAGEFENDARSGKGTLQSSLGNVYDGEWRLGVRSGQGLMTFGNGNGYFKGQWDEDRPEGEGKRAWTREGVALEGSFHLGVALGKAIARWADGSHFTSEWRASVPDGNGSFVAANGWKLEGVWEKGFFVEGSITHPDGRAVRGKVGHGWLPVLS